MLMRTLLLTAVVLGGLVFLSGAWPGPVAPSPQTIDSAFVPQSFPIDTAIIGSSIGASELLQKALEKLDAKRVTWLRTKIRQTMSAPESRFFAEGYLQRGPNHCARLEMEVDTNGNKGRLLVVSDGAMIASVRHSPNKDATVAVQSFPITDDASAKHEFLRTMNCGGPAVMLKEIQSSLRNGNLQTGLLHERRVIQISGDCELEANADAGSIAVCYCQVYLDAETLWPCQIEWFGLDALGNLKPIMRVEYTDPEFNQELSLSDCARLFSYQP